MSTDIERLIVSLEARFTRYERELARANQMTDRRVRAMQARFDGLGRGIGRVESQIVGSGQTIVRAFGVMGIALSTSSIIAMTSAWTDLESRITNAAGSTMRGTAVMNRLQEMARRTYSSLTQTSEGYLQNQQALTALGYSTEQQLDLVETLNNSLVISAVRGDRARSVMDAWSKAMAEGELRGDNLNTIIQSGGRLSKALADSMGVSVNELRRLGSEGKITTDVMFGVTGQLEQLRIEANNMPATAADGFVLLSDAVLRFVGEADKAIGSSSTLAETLITLADAISKAPEESWFDDFFRQLGDELAKTIEADVRDIQRILDAIEFFEDPANGILDLNEAMGRTVERGNELETSLAEAEQALVNLAVNSKGRFGEVDEAAQDLFQQILEGRGSADLARAAIEELAAVNPEFANLKAGIIGVIDTLFALRDAAVAARAAAENSSDVGSFPSWRKFGNELAPDLSDDGAPGGPLPPPPRTPPGGGGRKTSPAEQFGQEVERWEERKRALMEETALRASLNPLVNDYGFALERLKAQQDLENAAKKAGLPLDAARIEQINQLSTAYANAQVEAARLAEAQSATVQQMEDLRDAGREAFDTIIDGFIEGKDAGELFNDLMRQIGKNLISMGTNALFGKGGGDFGLLGGLFGLGGAGGKIPGREFGGRVQAGMPYIVGERRPELFVPNQSGTIIPRVPQMGSAAQGQSMSLTFAPTIDARGADDAAVARLTRELARQRAEFEGRVKAIVKTRGKGWI